MKKFIQKLILMTILMMVAQGAMARDLPRIVNLSSDQQPEIRRSIIEKHNAIESESLRISMTSKLDGFIEGKVCDQCETITVTITPQTKAYKDGIEVPLIRAKNRIGRFATVIYELDTENVSAIRW